METRVKNAQLSEVDDVYFETAESSPKQVLVVSCNDGEMGVC